METIDLVQKLKQNHTLEDAEFIQLIECTDSTVVEHLQKLARETALHYFGNAIFIRGLIEFTNYCKNDCYYCGIRRSNREAVRYRLTQQQALDCCEVGYKLGFRTFVLQGGEDPGYSDNSIVELLQAIKSQHADCAITLSFGEKSKQAYKRFKEAGADRYLLRHETADTEHYSHLHPAALSLENRKKCLYDLKELGFQVGTGFMVGSPHQTSQTLLKDLRFIEELKPEMIGIGPYLPHKDTPFCNMPKGSLELTLNLLSILRLMRPNALLPSTTALGTIDVSGREMGILAGANVVMPNLSPVDVRSKYTLYNDKIATGEEAAESKHKLEAKMNAIGYQLVVDRGDYTSIHNAKKD